METLWKAFFENKTTKENRNSDNLFMPIEPFSLIDDLNGLLITKPASIFWSMNYKLVDRKWKTPIEVSIKQKLPFSFFIVQVGEKEQVVVLYVLR